MSNDVRIGLIGVNGRGGLASHAHKPDEGSRLVAGADPQRKFLDTFTEKYKPDFVTTDYRELLARDDVDAVFICSPDAFHEEQAIEVVARPQHVSME